MSLLTEDGRPVKTLFCLANKHGINVAEGANALTLSEAMQSLWLRGVSHQYQIPGGMPGVETLTLLRELGMIEEISVPMSLFEGVLILGGTLTAVRKRLAFMVEQARVKTYVDTVYLLGGARLLDPKRENREALTTPAELQFRQGWSLAEYPKTEAEMMQFVFDQSDLPEKWLSFLIDAPFREDGSLPSTTDTVQRFLSMEPAPGLYVVVSGQPYVQRQALNVSACLPEGFVAIPSGYEATSTLPLAAFLDEVARLLFEELRLSDAS